MQHDRSAKPWRLTWANASLGTHADRYYLEASQPTPAAFAIERANQA